MRVSENHSLIYLRSLIFLLLNVFESGLEVTILDNNRRRNKISFYVKEALQCKYTYYVTLGVGIYL
jgi:hypothetical protein